MQASGCYAPVTYSCDAGYFDHCPLGATACCRDACISGKTRCFADGGLGTCSTGASGCLDWTITACSSGQYCPAGWNACVDAGTIADAGCTPQYRRYTGCKPCCTGLAPTVAGQWCAPIGCAEHGASCTQDSDCCTGSGSNVGSCVSGTCRVASVWGDPCQGLPNYCGTDLYCGKTSSSSSDMCLYAGGEGDWCRTWITYPPSLTAQCMPDLYCDVDETCVCDP